MRDRDENAMTPIEIEDAGIGRLRRMRALGPRASGVDRRRQIRAARREAKRMLHKLGYSQHDARRLMQNAHDA
jgi:hypothetical protein